MMNKILFFLLFAFFTTAFAGVTGKIAGIIKDANTHEPLPGVNVVLEGTYQGASSDADGYYVILNVPPGTYKLQFSYVGYKSVEVTDVKVMADITTNINMNMHETTLQTSEKITVIARRPLIQKDVVSTRHFVSSKEIEIQPINTFQGIAERQAGVVGSHFRGGRPGEVLVMIDGIPVRDPAGAYSGNLGGFTGDVPRNAIQEMEVSLGGFSAEYGNVQSGVINLALKEGGQKFSGRLRLTHTPKFFSETSFTEHGYKFKRLQPLENLYELNLNGPLFAKKLSFSFSGQVQDKNQGLYMNQNAFEQTYQGKVTYRFSNKYKLSVGGIVSRKSWDQFYFQASKYGPGPNYQSNQYVLGVPERSPDTLFVYNYVNDKKLYGTSKITQNTGNDTTYHFIKTFYMAGMENYLVNRRKGSNLAYLIWTHTLNQHSFYKIRLNTFYSHYHYATPDVDDRDHDGNRNEDLQWDTSKPGPHPIYREREANYWWVRGDDPRYLDQKSLTTSVKADLTSQINKNHLIKGGFEASLNDMNVQNISWTLGVGLYRKDIWHQKSFDFGAYLQDKIEFAGIIGIVGLRFDTFDPNGLGNPIYYPSDYSQPFSQVGQNGIPIFINPKKATIKYQFSPRIGISHPITNRSLLHFTYGHYFQRPDSYYLYRNNRMQSLTKVGNYIGDPNLQPEKTVAYEIGVEQQLSDDIKFDITGYYKDMTNLMNWRKYVGRTIQNIELNVYTNADYGNSKGLEFTLSKRLGKYWGGNINYTFSIAKGRSSNANGGSGSFTSVKRMNILDFDQTHTVNATLTLHTPSDFGTTFGSFHPFANWITNILFRYGSGLPYSSYGTNKINDLRQPWTSTTDLKLMRHFPLSRYGLNIFMDVLNLFNRKNVNWIGNSQYYNSGDPNYPSIKGDPAVVHREADGTYVRNPQAYSAGRQIRFGIGLTF